jgi:hypothetical protein
MSNSSCRFFWKAELSQSPAKPRPKIDEVTVIRLIEMYNALTKADEQLCLYFKLIATSSGRLKEILLQNFRDFYFNKIRDYLDTFLNVLDTVSNSYPEIPDMVKSRSCGSRESVEGRLKKPLEQYTQISDGGG